MINRPTIAHNGRYIFNKQKHLSKIHVLCANVIQRHNADSCRRNWSLMRCKVDSLLPASKEIQENASGLFPPCAHAQVRKRRPFNRLRNNYSGNRKIDKPVIDNRTSVLQKSFSS